MKKALEIIIPSIVILASAVFITLYLTHGPAEQQGESPLVTVTRPRRHEPALPPAPPKVPGIPAPIAQHSPEAFAYAHGTALADGKIFIGMAARSGNPFVTNQLYVFSNLEDLSQFRIISIPIKGDIESMAFDDRNHMLYFTLSNSGTLEIYQINPRTYFVSTVISTTSVNIGLKPAIVTDGKYVYGISYTDPSTVFKVSTYGARLTTSSIGHIANGHSAAIGLNGTATELYFGGGEADGFEKVDGATLSVLGALTFPGCNLTDDMPYQKVTDAYGYVYVGCEKQPYGYRIKTDDLSYARFSLPGNSYGMFIYGNDLYNAAQDGSFDVFKDMDINAIKRFSIGQDMQLNELFVTSGSSDPSAEASSTAITTDVFYTGWWGVKGLFESVI